MERGEGGGFFYPTVFLIKQKLTEKKSKDSGSKDFFLILKIQEKQISKFC